MGPSSSCRSSDAEAESNAAGTLEQFTEMFNTIQIYSINVFSFVSS
jgi:hypothetical protein